MKLRRIVPLDIENKILIPFACISLATVLCFCIILYFTEFQVKVETERQEAQTLIGHSKHFRRAPPAEPFWEQSSHEFRFLFRCPRTVITTRTTPYRRRTPVLAVITFFSDSGTSIYMPGTSRLPFDMVYLNKARTVISSRFSDSTS